MKRRKIKNLIKISIITLSIILIALFSYKYTTITWTTYSSDKVPLSFRLPTDWTVSLCDSPEVIKVFGMEEKLYFTYDCFINPSKGNVEVTRVGNISSPVTFLNEKFRPIFAQQGPLLNFEPISVGNSIGYLQSPSNDPDNKYAIYYVYSGEYEYRITVLKTNNTSKILSTFRF